MYNITLYDFVQKMKENGYEQIFGGLVKYENEEDGSENRGKVVGACALGQGMANLGALSVRSIDADTYPKVRAFWDKVMVWNDIDRLPLKEIYARIDKEFDLEEFKKIPLIVYTFDDIESAGPSIPRPR